MKRVFSLLASASVILLTLFSCSSGKQVSLPEELIGDWYTIKGDVELYSFMKDSTEGIYAGYLHDRLMVSGKWTAENGMIRLILEDGTIFGYDYSIKDDTMIFDNGREIYTKTPPVYILHPEVRILENLRTDLGYDFSQPGESTVNWIDGDQNGFSISVNTTLGSDYLGNITGYIKDSGYAPDSLCVTEICNGYKTDYSDTQIILTICTLQDPDAADDTVTIRISSALKK